jgi:hypothetical protein
MPGLDFQQMLAGERLEVGQPDVPETAVQIKQDRGAASVEPSIRSEVWGAP